MTNPKLFVHGVPDSPAIWRPLINQLDLPTVHVPHLPAFAAPAPAGFNSTMDEYAAWLLREAEEIHAVAGPIDIVGHDWGALLTLRVASLRPEIFNSWAVSNAVIDPAYRGHTLARMWATPLLGEIVVALTASRRLEPALVAAGVPADVAAAEAAQWKDGHIKKSVLRLYRSAKGLRLNGPWVDDLARLPTHGCVIWGTEDPFVPITYAESFCARHDVPLHRIEGADHWAIAERPEEVATHLHAHWAGS